MTRSTLLLGAVAFIANAGFAQAAEDHSAHQRQQATPQADEHAEHRNNAPTLPPQSSPVERGRETQDEHSGHHMPVAEGNEHAQHASHASDQPTESELAHVPPLPPAHPMHDMSNEAMIELMEMDDAAAVGMVLLDQFEWRELGGRSALFWDGQAWYGNDYNKVWFKMEGERTDDENEGSAELFWDRVIARWWSMQIGVRQDFSEGSSRTWAGFGVQGLAPYWFEVEATVYVGEEGRSAARFTGEYEVLLTQRLILQPKIELNLYGKEDPENGIGSGLSDAEIGLRLRYEIRREFAPYIGLSWSRQVGESAGFARAAGRDVSDLQFVAGLRAWF